jgi:phosphotransferase system enzyme I (PtsP)
LSYFPIEDENPFLGWRGIRVTLDHPEIFLTQLRAMIRASAGLDNLSILLPMITAVKEVDESLKLIEQSFNELVQAGEKVAMPKIGVMIEVPSAVYMADSISRRVDFLSIGTNDLTQYILAVDRNNSRVANLYDCLDPAVLRALVQVVDAAHLNGVPVSVCGEMAGDPAAVLPLLGMSIDSLSMNAAILPRIKWVIQSFSQSETRIMLENALRLEDAATIRSYLHSKLEQVELGGLVRAGK